ncbi:MAG: FAD-binding oxidoreductase [Anaerolineales bacterium]|nr:FAD-binding oxidoreductase [Anaerolineales bacterium]
MRRWNGWGDETTHYHLPETSFQYLVERVGDATGYPDATLEDALEAVPSSRLPAHPLIKTEAIDRLNHARGQSLPDWLELRSGPIQTYPDGVAYPTSDSQVQELLRFASQKGFHLIPYGGGTSVVGHINPLKGETPVLTVDMSRFNSLLELDETSRLATFGAGVCGPDLEKQLNERGYTLGHFPQSFELSTLGGWIATRSSGQQSYYYGRIEDLFAGGHVETPLGPLDLLPVPASAAGPDLRQVLLGSEGRLGLITRATVRIRPQPEVEAFYGVFFHDWPSGVEAVRQIAQARLPISMARLSNAQETDTTLALAGKDNLILWAKRGLNLLRYGDERCLLVFGITGEARLARLARQQVMEIARQHGGLFTGTMIGKTWRKSRFLTPYLRNTLWERGYTIDTLETAVPWIQTLPAAQDIQQAIHDAMRPYGERVLVFAHLSHVYRDGASVYVTYIFRRTADPEQTLRRWQDMKHAASQAIIAHGGTISHQHGVGLDHAPYLLAEKGEVGATLLHGAVHTLDPQKLLNPGKLIEEARDVAE